MNTTNRPAEVIEACVCDGSPCGCGFESKTVQPVHLFAGISRVACGATKWLSVALGPGEHITCDACKAVA